MTTLTSGWQEIGRYTVNLSYGNETAVLFAYATEDISGNYSTVHTLFRINVGGSGNYVNVSSWSLGLDGSAATGGGYTHWAEGDHDLAQGAWNVGHNSDGTGSVTIHANFSATVGLTSWTPSITVGLQTIPRTSNVSLSTSNIKLDGSSSVTIYTNRKSSSFSHTIQQNFSGSFVNLATGVGDSYTWVPSTDWYSTIGSGSKAITIRLYTYSGSTQIGYTDTTLTITSAGASPAKLSADSLTLDGTTALTIYTNKASTSFSHTIQQNFSGTFVNIATGVIDSTTWTPPVSYYTTIAGGSKAISIRCITFNTATSTQIGYVDKTFTITSSGPDTVSVSSSNMVMDTSYTITIAKKVSNFTHTLTYDFVNLKTQSIATGVDTSTSWKPLSSLSAQIPNAISASGTITCTTLYGSTPIGTSAVPFTLSVPDYSVSIGAPTITETGKDNNGVALSSRGVADTEVVAIMSIKSVVVGATTKYNATILSILVTFGGVTNPSNSGTFDSSTNGYFSTMTNATITIIATDSRQKSITYTNTYTYRDYYVPLVQTFSAKRTAETSSTGTADSTGTFWNSKAGDVTNAVTYAISGGATGTGSVTVPSTGKWSITYALTGILYTNKYSFTIKVTDSFGYSSSKDYTLNASVPVIWHGRNTVKIYDYLIVNSALKTINATFTGAVTAVNSTISNTLSAVTANITGTLKVVGTATFGTTKSSRITQLTSGNVLTYSIPVASVVANTDSYSKWPYCYDYSNSEITENTYITVDGSTNADEVILSTSCAKAWTTLAGKIRIYFYAKPSAAVTVKVTVIFRGVTS